MQKKLKSHQYRISSMRKYQPAKTQSWRSLHLKNSKNQVINSALKESRPDPLEDIENEGWKLNEHKLIKDLQNSFQIEYSDKNKAAQNAVIGSQAIKSFYKHYKNLDKIVDQNGFQKIKPSVYTSILTKCENLKIFPSKVGVVKQKGEANKIDITHSLYGGKYIQAIAEGMKSMSVTSCNFNSSRFNTCSANSEIPSLSKGLEVLKLQNNSINARCISSFHKLFQNGSRLLELDLANNKLTDNGVYNLCQTLQNNTRIRIINLSQNGLTCRCTESLANLCKGNNLEEIYLQWNKIKAEGGKNIFDAVSVSQSIKVLDISWNLIGNQALCVQSLGKMFKENMELYHLNLSNNSFTKQECISIAQHLESNKTIYGFHFQGNYGFVNSKGFINISDSQTKQINSINSKSGFPEVYSYIRKKSQFSDGLVKDVCWLCQGWIQHQFILQLPDEQEKDVWIHLGFDGFHGFYIGKSNRKTISYTCMIPPIKFQFFWTVGQQQTISSRYPHSILRDNYSLKQIKIGSQVIDIFIQKRNYYQSPNKRERIDLLPENVRPRDCSIQESANEAKFHAIQLPQIHKQSQKQFQQNFQQEWKMFLNQKFIEEEDIDACKAILYKNYQNLRQIYRYYSCFSETISNNMVMDSSSIKIFCSQHQIFQSQFTQEKIKDLLMDMFNSSGSFCKQIIEGIPRSRIIELFCRIVTLKYIGLQFVQGLSLFMQTLQMNLSVYQKLNQWRDRVLYLEGLHKQTKKYNKRFQTLFNLLLKSSNSKQSVGFTWLHKVFGNKMFWGKPISLVQLKRACYYSRHHQDSYQQNRIISEVRSAQFIEFVARLAFVDERGEIIDEYSLSSRRDRLQKMIDFMPSSME